MKAITIWQPWATLIMEHGKDVENRTWPTRYRGSLVIHAGKSLDYEAMERFADILPRRTDLVLGACLCMVTMTACLRWDADNPSMSKWHEKGCWGWYFANVRPFPAPVPYKGKQGLWSIPDEEVEAMVKGLWGGGAQQEPRQAVRQTALFEKAGWRNPA